MFENDLSDMHLLLFAINGSYHFISTRYKASFAKGGGLRQQDGGIGKADGRGRPSLRDCAVVLFNYKQKGDSRKAISFADYEMRSLKETVSNSSPESVFALIYI